MNAGDMCRYHTQLGKMPYTAEFRGTRLSIEIGHGSKVADNISRTASAEHRKKRGRHIRECIDRQRVGPTGCICLMRNKEKKKKAGAERRVHLGRVKPVS